MQCFHSIILPNTVACVLFHVAFLFVAGCGHDKDPNELVKEELVKTLATEPFEIHDISINWKTTSSGSVFGDFSATATTTEGYYKHVDDKHALKKLKIVENYEKELARAQINILEFSIIVPFNDTLEFLKFYDLVIPKEKSIAVAGTVALSKFDKKKWQVDYIKIIHSDVHSFINESKLRNESCKLDDPKAKNIINKMIENRKTFIRQVDLAVAETKRKREEEEQERKKIEEVERQEMEQERMRKEQERKENELEQLRREQERKNEEQKLKREAAILAEQERLLQEQSRKQQEYDELKAKIAAHREAGIAHHANAQYAMAIQSFNTAIMIDSRNAELYLRRGRSHFKNGSYAAALQDVEIAAKLDPRHYDTLQKARAEVWEAIKCTNCGGKGQILQTTTGRCLACQGSGRDDSYFAIGPIRMRCGWCKNGSITQTKLIKCYRCLGKGSIGL